MKNKNVPKIRFKGFSGEWEKKGVEAIAELNPKAELPEVFKYVDLESVVGTEMISCREEKKNSAPSRAQRLANRGDIFYQMVRPYQRNNYLFEKYDVNYVFSTGYAQIRPSTDSYFLFSLVQSDFFARTVLLRCTGTSYPAISSNDLAKIEISFPIQIDEQRPIGNYFQNIDNLINTSQSKLDKLKNIKKSCLEKMFPKKGATVPEIRFKGFNGEWEEKTLGEMGYTFTGLSGKTKEDFGHGNAEFITYMNVFANSISNRYGTEKVEIDNKQNEVQYGDILFTTSSETPEEVGMSSVWLSHDDNVYLNSFCFGYKLNEEVYPYYMAHLLRSPSIREKIAFLAQGISRYNISKNKVMDISLPFPNPDEQKQIGNYFQTLDNLIAKQEQQLTKLKNIKKACLEKMFVNTSDAL